MAKIPHVTVRGKEKCRLDLGKVDGKRVRAFHDTETDAVAALSAHERELKRSGDVLARMLAQDRRAMISVYEEVKAAGKTLREVWEAYKRDHGQKPVVTSVPYREAVEELSRRKLKSGKDERYVNEMCSLLLRFGEGQLDRRLDQIPAKELQDWVDSQAWGLSAKKSNYGRFSSLWSMAIDLGWASVNIVDRLEPIGKLQVKVAIWPNATCLRLLAATQANDNYKRVTASIALGLFGCMRPEEISHEKMSWDIIDIPHGQVTVPAEIAKTGDPRTFKLQPLALDWLTLAKKQGSLLPCPNERRLIDGCCDLAGITEWPHDILRKCCATIRVTMTMGSWPGARGWRFGHTSRRESRRTAAGQTSPPSTRRRFEPIAGG